MNLPFYPQVPLEKLGISEEQLQRKRKEVGRQAYKKFTNEDDSDSEVEPKQDYGSQKETNVQEAISQGYISEQNSVKRQSAEYGYDQGKEPVQGEVPRQILNGTPQKHEEGYQYEKTQKEGTGMPGKDQFYKDETTKVKNQPTEMPLSTEVSLKTYLMSIFHMPRSLQVYFF